MKVFVFVLSLCLVAAYVEAVFLSYGGVGANGGYTGVGRYGGNDGYEDYGEWRRIYGGLGGSTPGYEGSGSWTTNHGFGGVIGRPYGNDALFAH